MSALGGCRLGNRSGSLPQALDCALEALRDRTPGTIDWTRFEGFGMIDYGGQIRILDNGMAQRSESGSEDVCSYDEGEEVGMFRSPDYFENCLAGDLHEKFDCLEATVLESVVATCVAPNPQRCDED